MVLMVTGLRALGRAAPRGECELRLTCATGSKACDSAGDDEHIRGCGGVILDVVRREFTKARDMAAATARWWNGIVEWW